MKAALFSINERVQMTGGGPPFKVIILNADYRGTKQGWLYTVCLPSGRTGHLPEVFLREIPVVDQLGELA